MRVLLNLLPLPILHGYLWSNNYFVSNCCFWSLLWTWCFIFKRLHWVIKAWNSWRWLCFSSPLPVIVKKIWEVSVQFSQTILYATMWNRCRMFGHACTQTQVLCHRLKLKGLEAKKSSSQNTQRLIKFQKSFVTVVQWQQALIPDTLAQRLLNRKLQYSSWVLLPYISSYRWRGDDVWKELLIDGNGRSKQSWNWWPWQ